MEEGLLGACPDPGSNLALMVGVCFATQQRIVCLLVIPYDNLSLFA